MPPLNLEQAYSGPRSVVQLGATGAVGGHAAQTLAGLAGVARLTILGRRDATLENPACTVQQHRVDIHDPQTYAGLLDGHSSALCTLGVGQPSKMTKEAFVSIDKTAVLNFAKACKAAGVQHFVLLSSVGVSSTSRSFFLRTKGELEEALTALEFERLSLFHPSMILTPTNRYGWSQAVTLRVWPWLSWLMPGGLRRFRGTKVARLGAAMAHCITTPGSGGVEVLEWDDFQRLTSPSASAESA